MRCQKTIICIRPMVGWICYCLWIFCIACSTIEEPPPLPLQHLGMPVQKGIEEDHFLSFLNHLQGLDQDGKKIFYRFETISRLGFFQDIPITITGDQLWKDKDIFKQPWEIDELYENLPGEPQQPHQIYFDIQVGDEENRISWNTTEYTHKKNFGHTIGSIHAQSDPSETTFDISAQVNVQLEDLSPDMILAMIHSFLSYWTDPQENFKPETWKKIEARFPHLSVREKQILARWSEDMPKTFDYFCQYVSIQDILDTPEVKEGRMYFSLRLQPRIEPLEQDYPDFADQLEKTKENLHLLLELLSATNRQVIGKMSWENGEMLLQFSLPLSLNNKKGPVTWDEILPHQTISKIDFSFSYLGTSLEMKGVELDNVWTADAQTLCWETSINRMPTKLELTGFFGVLYKLFESGPSLQTVFETLISKNNAKKSGIALCIKPAHHQQILQLDMSGPFPVGYVVRHSSNDFFSYFLSPNPKRDFFAFRRGLYRQFFQDYLTYRNQSPIAPNP